MSYQRSQESRQPWAWLIFGVSQKMTARTILFVLFLLVFACVARAGGDDVSALLSRDSDGAYRLVIQNKSAKMIFYETDYFYSVEVFEGGKWVAIPLVARCGLRGLPLPMNELRPGASFTEYFFPPESLRSHAGKSLRLKFNFSFDRGGSTRFPAFTACVSDQIVFSPAPSQSNPFLRFFPKNG
jgi:hypothetical protein